MVVTIATQDQDEDQSQLACKHEHPTAFEFPFKVTSAYYRFCTSILKSIPFPWPVPNPDSGGGLYNPISILPDKFLARVPWYAVSMYQPAIMVFVYASFLIHAREYVANSDFVEPVLHVTLCLAHSLVTINRFHPLQRSRAMHAAFNFWSVVRFRSIEFFFANF